MKTFVPTMFVAIILATVTPASADHGASPFSWKRLVDDSGKTAGVRFMPIGTSGSIMTMYPRNGSRCTDNKRADTWPNFLATVARDTSNKVYVDVQECGDGNSRVCVDVEDKRDGELSFDPHICATLRVAY